MDDAPKLIGYKLTRSGCGKQWVFAGVTPQEVAIAVQNEIMANEGLSAEECDSVRLEAFEITQAEIDDMPEFEGW